MSTAALFLLRRRIPNASGLSRLGISVCTGGIPVRHNYLLINTFLATPVRAFGGIVLIALGLPLYEYFTRYGRVIEPLEWTELGNG